ncbi:MAG: hypothetical protein GTO23_09970, partial [Nitrososphaeria archaeon]|nr:hypothetical protein [Nitrososphaeria archaeon]
MSMTAIVGQVFSYIALTFGIFFFLYACKYYFAILIALFSGRPNRSSNGHDDGINGINRAVGLSNDLFGSSRKWQEGNGDNFFSNGDGGSNGKQEEPFVS